MATAEREKILIATDGSKHSLATVRYVSSILNAERFEVVLFHVLTRVPESFIDLEKVPAYQYRLVSVESWEKAQQKAINEHTDNALAIFAEAGFAPDAITVKLEERKVGIARDVAAESKNGYTAVVVGRKGISELKDFMLGSIANKILELVSIPLWIVGGSKRPGKVLMCMDNSGGAMLAADHLCSILKGASKCEVTLLHIVRAFSGIRKFMHEFFSSEEHKATVESIEEELKEAAKVLEPSLDKVQANLVAAGVDAQRINKKISSASGNAGVAIIEEAEKGGYDTIVVGRRGLSRTEEFLMGRVSNKVVHLAKEKTVWIVS
jgi:nucleotide-binding universal stress UspA family protein